MKLFIEEIFYIMNIKMGEEQSKNYVVGEFAS